jgi:hypothetical protein
VLLLEWVGLGYVRLGSVGSGCTGQISPGTYHGYLKVILRYFQGHFMIMSRSFEGNVKVTRSSYSNHISSGQSRSE